MLRPLFYGDIHPLTGYTPSKTAWMAYQLHREDLGRGAVLTPGPGIHDSLLGGIPVKHVFLYPLHRRFRQVLCR